MKWLFNARTVAISFVVAIAATIPSAVGQAQVTVNTNWVQTATTGPSPRGGPSMAYDLMHRKTVLFGGSSGYLSDTWQYDGTSWTQLQVTGPSGRYLAPMVYDSARGVSVLFGGYNYNGILSDTWEWDGSTWIHKLPLHTPPARLWTAMTYDSARHATVLFGGAPGTGLLNDTWHYDGSDWQQVPTNININPRLQAAISYDPNRAEVVLFGGAANIAYNPQYGDTWALRGVTTSPLDWQQAAATPAPSPRVFSVMDYDSARGVSVLFGGSSDSGPGNLHDT